jgi:hypothetical protein
MGIIDKDQHDVFFSYATLDNELQSNWIKDFRDDLKKRVCLQLKTNESKEVDLDHIDFFIDVKGLPANGGLVDELKDAIKRSHFLFMFVGEGYLRSDYCAKELEWFSSRFSSLERQALNHMFMMMLTRSAVKGASVGKLGEIKSKAKYENVFDEDSGTPIDRLLPTEDGRLASNPAYTDLVSKIAKALVDRILDRILEKRVVSPVVPSADGVMIAFGSVTRSLKEYRTTLAREIEQASGVKADLLEFDDLASAPDEIRKRLNGAKLFIQLIDKSPVGMLGGAQPGGFLAVQEELVDSEQMLWMEPSDKPDVALKETDALHLAYLDQVSAAALKGSRAEFVREVLKRLRSRSRPAPTVPSARIILEHSDSDQEQVAHVRRLVEVAWNSDIARNGMQLKFAQIDWDQMKEAPELLQTCHGIVVIDRSKPLTTLYAQLSDIEDELVRRNYELEQRTFVLPPKSSPTIMNWPTILFKAQNDNPDFLVVTREKLHEFLGSVMNKALAAKSSSPHHEP